MQNLPEKHIQKASLPALIGASSPEKHILRSMSLNFE
jgi:hypothetical protein